RARDSAAAVHDRRRTAAHSRALGAPGDRGPGGLHRVDRPRQTASPASAWRPLRQSRPRRRPRDAVITHPEKVLFPADGITKGEIARYYETIAPLMLPHVRAR